MKLTRKVAVTIPSQHLKKKLIEPATPVREAAPKIPRPTFRSGLTHRRGRLDENFFLLSARVCQGHLPAKFRPHRPSGSQGYRGSGLKSRFFGAAARTGEAG